MPHAITEPNDRSISFATTTRVNGIAINAKYGVVVISELYMSYDPQVSVDLQKKNAHNSSVTSTIAICRAYLRNSLVHVPFFIMGESGLLEFMEAMGNLPS